MRLECIDMPARYSSDGDGDYRVTFRCDRFEALDLQTKGFSPEYKAVMTPKIKQVIKSTNYCAKSHNTKVIFNHPATILFINGKKYVSKVHKEEFDEEKGLLMCLAKANGISHLELQRMIKGAKK